MNPMDLIGTSLYDTDGRQYSISGILGEGGQGVVFKTKEEFLIKINTSPDKGKYLNRYRWLIKNGSVLPKETRIAYPIALLQEPYIGYIMKEAKGHVALKNYVNKPEEINSFVDWYFNASGGLVKRLQIGYLLGKSLRYLHLNGYAYVDLSPGNVLVSQTKNSIVIIDSDNITSGTYTPLISGTELYRAPEVTKGTAAISSLTDTYSYAVLLFQMLTACHPFVGDEAEDENPEIVYERVDRGEAEYIGNPDSTINKSNIYENSKIFLTDEISELFSRTFVDGKNDSSLRPTIMEFMNACKRAEYKAAKCEWADCGADYYYAPDAICPVCGKQNKNYRLVRYVNQIKSKKKLLMPYDDKKEFSSIPVITDNKDFIVLKPGPNPIKRSFFDENVPFDLDKTAMTIVVNPEGKLSLYNLSSGEIYVTDKSWDNIRKVSPYDPSDNNVKNGVEIGADHKVEYIILKDNMNIALMNDEKNDISVAEKYYGETILRKYLIVE